jgi:hypothetical protein
MWPLVVDFFSKKSAGVRGLRFAITVLGAIGLAAGIAWPEPWIPYVKAISGVCVVVGPLITGYTGNVEDAARQRATE